MNFVFTPGPPEPDKNKTASTVYSGRVNAVTYTDGGDFYIVKLVLDSQVKNTTAKGHFPGQAIKPGSWVCFTGVRETHATYGEQLQVTQSPVIPDCWTPDRILSILSAQGIGPGARMALTLYAQGQALPLLELLDSGGLPPELVHVSERWIAAKAHLYAAAFMAAAGLPASTIKRVWAKYSTDVEAVLTKNPWVLVQIDGISFSVADEVARRMGVPMNHPGRLQGAVLGTMGSIYNEGHLFATMSDILSNALELVPNANDKTIAEAVRELIRARALVLDRKTRLGTVAIYDAATYDLECSCANLLRARAQVVQSRDNRPLFARVGPQAEQAFTGVDPGAEPADLRVIVHAALSDWSSGSGLSLTEDQTKATVSALVDNVSVITGLPGTGKTLSMRAVVMLLKDAGISFQLVAPTGIAAKRLTNVVNAPAATIHRAFGARGAFEKDDREAAYEGFLDDGDSGKKASGTVASKEAWGYGPGNPHPADVLIVDETSMVDLHMLSRILLGTRPDCRLIFVGDPYQLPSVGAGAVLADLVESKVFPHTHLDRIFRQEDTSGIVFAAHSIYRGQNPEPDGRDFIQVPASSEAEASEIILALSDKLYKDRVNFQVLSPRHSGEAGVTALNDSIRSNLNPPLSGMAEIRIGGSVVREGDRVMVIKNDYQLGVYNGDVGTIRRIDRAAKEIEMGVFGLPGTPSTIVRFAITDAAKYLRLAYAQTVHKCVHPSTIVWHRGGLCPIACLPASGKIGTPEGERPYDNVITNPVGPLLEIRVKSGYRLLCTPEHGVDVWDRELGRYVRKEAREIKRRDTLCLVPAPSNQGSDTLPYKALVSNSNILKMPLILDEQLAEFLGIISAFGSVKRAVIGINVTRVVPIDPSFSNVYSEGRNQIELLLDKIKGLYKQLFHRAISVSAQGKNQYRLIGRFRVIINWLMANFPETFQSRGSHIPFAVMDSRRSVRRAFLRGYFLSCRTLRVDVSDPESEIRCVWVRCRNDATELALRALLLDESIICRRTVKGPGTITIQGLSLDRFFNSIGFDHPDCRRLSASPRMDCPADDLVPLGRAERFGVYERQSTNHYAPAHKVLERFPHLSNRTRFFHDYVDSIVETIGPSMCITVPETHRFIQNGFSGWNSQGQEYDVIVLPLLTTFGRQLQRNLLYTAITRARKKVYLVGQASAIHRAVQNNAAEFRRTLLANRLQQDPQTDLQTD